MSTLFSIGKIAVLFWICETNLTSVKLERKEENEVQLKVSTDYANSSIYRYKKDIVQSKELSETLGIPKVQYLKSGRN